MPAASSPRSRSSSAGEASASADVTIAVTGERRSCETARSTAVLISSERRSARVSTTSRVSVSRARPAASSASSAGRTAATSSSAACGTSSVPSRSPSRASGIAAERSSAPTVVEHEPAGRELVRLRDALRGGAERRREVGRAEQHARELGGQPCLALRAHGLGRPAPGGLGQARGDAGGDEEDDERDEVLAVGDREAAGRRDVEEVEGQRARRRS